MKFKYINLFRIIIPLISIGLIVGCYEKKSRRSENEITQYKKPLIRVNRYLVNSDSETIKKFAQRNNWKMTTTNTGLWYMIIKHGIGKKAQTGNYITFNYKVKLLNGNVCYTSDSSGPKTVKIGSSDIEKGLHEGLVLLSNGDKARFIIPPHLAWGITGDDNKIPPRAIIIYEIEVLDITDKYEL